MGESKREKARAFLTAGEWNSLGVLDAIMETSLSSSEKLVIMAVVSHWSRKYTQPSPGVRRLATMASLRPNTVTDTISRLEQKGILRVVRRHRQAHTYDLSGTLAGLLAVCPSDTDAVSVEATEAVCPSDTEAAPEPPPAVSVGTTAVSDEALRLYRMGTPKGSGEGTIEEGTRERPSQSSGPPSLKPPVSSRVGKRKKATKVSKTWQVPSDWQPNDKHRALAKERELVFDDEVAKYRTFVFDRKKPDVDAGFQNWLLNAHPPRKQNGNGNGHGPRQKNHGSYKPRPVQTDSTRTGWEGATVLK